MHLIGQKELGKICFSSNLQDLEIRRPLLRIIILHLDNIRTTPSDAFTVQVSSCLPHGQPENPPKKKNAKQNASISKLLHRHLLRIISAKSHTSPLSKNAPARTSIRQHQSSPYSSLSNLDDRLPCATISFLRTKTRALHLIILSHQP